MNTSLLTTILTGFNHNDKFIVTEEYVEDGEESIKRSVNTGYNSEEEIQSKLRTFTIDTSFEESIKETVDSGFSYDDKPAITEEYVEKNDDSIKESVKTGYATEIQPIELKIPTVDIDDVTFEESVKETVDTGFGEGTLHQECPQPKYVEYLRSEGHLGEFKTDTDKELARQNLGVYSSNKIDQLLKNITDSVGSIYVTKNELNLAMSELALIDSTLKAYADYEVPENLFKL